MNIVKQHNFKKISYFAGLFPKCMYKKLIFFLN